MSTIVIETPTEIIISAPHSTCRLAPDLNHIDTVRAYKDTPETICLQIRAGTVSMARGADKSSYSSAHLQLKQLDALIAKLTELRALL